MTTHDAPEIIDYYAGQGWPTATVAAVIDQLYEAGLDLPKTDDYFTQQYSDAEFTTVGEQLSAGGTGVMLVQSEDDWNQLRIIFPTVDNEPPAMIDVTSTAHTFTTGDDGTTSELNDFNAQQWLDDIDAALSATGWTRTDDPETLDNFTQRCTVTLNNAQPWTPTA